MKGRLVVGAALCACASILGTTAVDAAKPDTVRIDFEGDFHDDFLSDACGFDITTHEEGHLVLRTFDRSAGLLSVNTINVALTASANGKVYRFRDVGADVTRATPDGVVIVSIIGQLPFGFTGVLKIDTGTGEAIHEPQHANGDPSDVCEALAP